MKTCLTWTLKKRKFSPLVFQGNIEETFRVVKELGCDGLELSMLSPGDVSLKDLIRLKDDYSISVPAIGTGLAYVEEGLSFSSDDKAVRSKAASRFRELVDFAAGLGADIIFGLIRGRLSDDIKHRDGQERRVKEIVASCAGYAQGLGVTIIVEPINRYETNYLNTVYECHNFIEDIALGNIKLMADTFHMNIEEQSLVRSIADSAGKLKYFHLADSNRQFPGRGHLDIKAVLNSLKGINYSGFLSLECISAGDAVSEAREALNHINGLLQHLPSP